MFQRFESVSSAIGMDPRRSREFRVLKQKEKTGIRGGGKLAGIAMGIIYIGVSGEAPPSFLLASWRGRKGLPAASCETIGTSVCTESNLDRLIGVTSLFRKS